MKIDRLASSLATTSELMSVGRVGRVGRGRCTPIRDEETKLRVTATWLLVRPSRREGRYTLRHNDRLRSKEDSAERMESCFSKRCRNGTGEGFQKEMTRPKRKQHRMIVTGITKQRTYNTKTCSRHGGHHRTDYVPRIR